MEKERITIATVQKGEFNDYIRVIGQVLPDRIIYLDAIEGGRVEERLIEEGAQVRAGDVIGVREDGTEVRAPYDGCVLFPHPEADVGQEWFYLAVFDAAA